MITTDHASRACRQPASGVCRGSVSPGSVGLRWRAVGCAVVDGFGRDGGDEGIAHSDLSGDVAHAVLTVSENSAQVRHVEAQAAIFHHHIGPDASQQFLSGDDPARLLHERNEQIEGAPADLDRDAVSGKQSLAGRQPEWTERYPVNHIAANLSVGMPCAFVVFTIITHVTSFLAAMS